MTAGQVTVDTGEFRQVLGHFCTGVTVITAMRGDVPVGFACQSFAALSLDPPLVLFCPGKRSRTWSVIQRNGRFCVNVLAHSQRDVSETFGHGGPDKFARLSWHRSPGGAPVLDGVLTWIDCTVEAAYDGGDHQVVIGRVIGLGPRSGQRPLLFYRGGYTVTERPEEWVRAYPDEWL